MVSTMTSNVVRSMAAPTSTGASFASRRQRTTWRSAISANTGTKESRTSWRKIGAAARRCQRQSAPSARNMEFLPSSGANARRIIASRPNVSTRVARTSSIRSGSQRNRTSVSGNRIRVVGCSYAASGMVARTLCRNALRPARFIGGCAGGSKWTRSGSVSIDAPEHSPIRLPCSGANDPCHGSVAPVPPWVQPQSRPRMTRIPRRRPPVVNRVFALGRWRPHSAYGRRCRSSPARCRNRTTPSSAWGRTRSRPSR